MKVVVIGAGAAGLGIGWRLAQCGVDVVVLERGQPGQGATWAAAGMLTAPEDTETELARRGAELWPNFACEIEAASGRAVSYRVPGGLLIAKSADEMEQLRARAGELLSADEARAVEPRITPDILGGSWSMKQAKVDNRALGPALATAFVNAGGSLLLNETVVRFELRDDGIIGVRTPFALHQGDWYVLAAGAWSSRIEGLPPDALPPVVPVKGEMLALTPPAGEMLPAAGIGGIDIYMVAQRERLFVGATVERVGFDSHVTHAASQWLLAGARALVPSLRDWNIAEHWAGLRPGSPDDLPIIGKSALDQLLIASGQFRNGILYAPAIAEVMSALVLGSPTSVDISPFDPQRFAQTMCDV